MSIEKLGGYLRERISVDESGCWLWTGSVNRYGYGRRIYSLSPPGRVRHEHAHRAVWKELVGPLGDADELHHECAEKRCVNPAHLRVMSKAEHSAHHTDEFCKRGHSMADAYQYPRNGRIWRTCRECQKERQRRYKRERREGC
jgi:hypothetical protein